MTCVAFGRGEIWFGSPGKERFFVFLKRGKVVNKWNRTPERVNHSGAKRFQFGPDSRRARMWHYLHLLILPVLHQNFRLRVSSADMRLYRYRDPPLVIDLERDRRPEAMARSDFDTIDLGKGQIGDLANGA